MGHLCGYIRIPYSHPWYKKSKGSIQCRLNNAAHGGVTYDRTKKAIKSRFMKRGRWVGFDCGHAGDYQPHMQDILTQAGMPPEFTSSHLFPAVYRDLNYVIGCVTLMAHDIGGCRGL